MLNNNKSNADLLDALKAAQEKDGCVTDDAIMASPGAGKTTTLLRTMEQLGERYKIGVMEADIDAEVDAETMEKAGVRTIQIHTGGECAMTPEMTMQAIEEFHTEDLDLLFLENVGNLVCPAKEDTGANISVAILSVPEGDDKPLKYPLMFEVCDAVIINKIDTRKFFKFDDEAVVERIHNCNPSSEVFFISAKTGEGVSDWTEWLCNRIDADGSDINIPTMPETIALYGNASRNNSKLRV